MPSVSTAQTQMKVFKGVAPSLDGNHLIDDIAFMLDTSAKTADYTIKGSDSGRFFTTQGATGDIEFTLPAVATSGFVCWIYNAEDVECLVTVADGTILGFHDAGATGISYTTASNHIGNGFMMVSTGTKWLAFCMRGDHDAAITLVT